MVTYVEGHRGTESRRSVVLRVSVAIIRCCIYEYGYLVLTSGCWSPGRDVRREIGFLDHLAVDLVPLDVHVRYPRGVFDVVERIGIEDNEGGVLPRRDRPERVQPERLRGILRGNRDGLHRREAEISDHQPHV